MSKVYVLTTNEVATLLEFFTVLGLDFVQEQHDDGPIHYACSVGGNVFEIYPGKDGCSFKEYKQK